MCRETGTRDDDEDEALPPPPPPKTTTHQREHTHTHKVHTAVTTHTLHYAPTLLHAPGSLVRSFTHTHTPKPSPPFTVQANPTQGVSYCPVVGQPLTGTLDNRGLAAYASWMHKQKQQKPGPTRMDWD